MPTQSSAHTTWLDFVYNNIEKIVKNFTELNQAKADLPLTLNIFNIVCISTILRQVTHLYTNIFH